jgi:hypothetical protein
MATAGPDAHDRTDELEGDDAGSNSGDLHMTPAAGGVVSENYYTALEDEVEDGRTEGSDGGVSESLARTS